MKNWTRDDITDSVAKTLKSGILVPGYGCAILRKTDPRFMCELEFAVKYIKGLDAGSGALLMPYGLTQNDDGYGKKQRINPSFVKKR